MWRCFDCSKRAGTNPGGDVHVLVATKREDGPNAKNSLLEIWVVTAEEALAIKAMYSARNELEGWGASGALCDSSMGGRVGDGAELVLKPERDNPLR